MGVDYGRVDADLEWQRIAGGRWLTQLETVELTLSPFEDLTWTAEVRFLFQDWGLQFAILGQEGFLDRWVVSFNYLRNYFVVEEPESFETRLPPDVEEEFERAEQADLGWRQQRRK